MLRSILLASIIALVPVPAFAAGAEVHVYRGGGCTGRERLPAYLEMAGRAPDGVVAFTERTTWQNLLNSVNWSINCWSGTPYRVSQAVPMLLDSGTTMQEGVAGAYDEHFRKLGELLVSKGRANAFLRVGWEFNGDWYKWSAAKDPETFKAYFRRIVGVLRSVPGQQFQIVWNTARGEQKIKPDLAYPGDDVVDVIAMDIYNTSWRQEDKTDPELRWKNLISQTYSLNWLADFAAQHGKPIALPEWGTGTSPNGQGMGDDPVFIHHMAEWIRNHNVVYHAYWDYAAWDYNAELSGGKQPLAAAAYREEFGPR